MNSNAMNMLMKPNRAKQSDDPAQMLHVDFISVEEHFTRAVKHYDEARTEYFNHLINENGLRQRTLLWEKAARRLAAWAELWFDINPDKKDEQEHHMVYEFKLNGEEKTGEQ